MTSLHLGPEDYEGVVHDHTGRIRLDLTDAGTQRLAGAVRQFDAARREPGQRAEWLRSLPDVELVELATGRWGGPEDDVLEEAVRRLQVLAEKLRPAVDAVRAVGLVDQAAEEPETRGAAGGEA
ncbi:hypothetical protein [Streptomyces sp. NRRL S-350]|uniref:hypothetical protein n=1 Tax=Streptomyces sp. NRRL S-350 TaxID=1463902 RepID=UPI0004BF225E|nr:hypothetical protein [Streptomyces sp. NRRL S-350]